MLTFPDVFFPGAAALDDARAALTKLAAADNDEYGRLVRSLDPDQPSSLS